MGAPLAASVVLSEPIGASVTVSLDPTSQSVAEGSPASFEAVLSGTVASDVVVKWKTVAGSAVSGTDYTAQAATSLTIAAGETRSSAFTVATAADTLSEDDETFRVRIEADPGTPLPANVSIHPTANTATTTITDDAADALTATVSRAGATVAEGSNAVFTVTLSGGTSTAPVTVRYETTGSATSGSDYAAPSGSLTIASGLATGTVTIATTADTVLDRGETLGLRLTGVSGGGGASSLGSTTSAATTITDAGTAAVGWSATSRSVDEGREATLTLSLSGAVSAPVTVKWKTTGVSATSGTDYTAQALTAVTIAAGSTTASLTVQTSADTLAEGSETFTVSLEADTDNPLPSGVSLGTTSATVTIDDDEALLVNISADAVSVVEGGSAAYTVTVTGGTSTAPVVVSYETGGTATAADDYTAPSGSLTVASGQATAAITIATATDTVLDPGETLRVTLTGVSGGGGAANLGTGTSAETTLTDAGSVTVSLEPTSRSVAEGSPASFEAVLSGTVARDVVVSWKTADGTAGSADYTAQSATSLTIAAGATSSGAFTVATAADTLSEGDETFQVRITADSGTPLPSNVSISPTADTATATITDDSVTVSLDPASQSVAEGSPASFKAVLSGTVANAVVVSWKTAAGGTAISGTDYTAQAATSLTIAAGATSSGAFTVTTAADTLSEGDETFQVRIAADSGNPLPSNVSIHPTGNTATATITDDAADAMTATVAVSAAAVAEGSNAVFTVTLSGGTSTAPVVVSYETTGTATSGRDYTAPSGSLTIAAGVSTGTITVATAAESPALLEPNETLSLTLTGLSGGGGSSSLGAAKSAETTITDSGTVTVGFSAASASVAEGRTARLTVSLSGTVSDDVTVKWKTTGVSATSGTDYTAQALTAVTIAAGSTTASLTVQTSADTLAEGSETFTVSLEADTDNPLPSGVSLGTTSATVTIDDDESLLVNVSADAVSVTEGGSAAYTVAVTGGTSTAPVVVSYTVSGTATSVADYTEPSGSLTVASGDATAAITIATTADTVLDPGETLSVTLSGASTTKGSVSVGAPSEASVVLAEPTGTSVTVSLDPTSQSVAEGSPASFEAVLSGTVARDVVVKWKTVAGSAVSGTDYTAQAATSLTIAAGATRSGAFTVATAADTLSEDNETFRVEIAADSGNPLPSNVSISPTANTATATITDDSVTVSLDPTSRSVAEGSPASFKAVLSGTVANAVVVSWTTVAGGTAISDTDYTAQAATSLTIAAGATSSGAFTVATAADTLSEGDETFQVRIAADSGNPLPSNVSIHPTGNTATATITDDAADAMTATVAVSAATVAEGSNAVFTVTLSGGTSTAPVVVSYETSGSATPAADYTAPSGSLTIAAGAATGTITVATAAESPALLEPNETLSLTLTGLSGGGGSSSLGAAKSAETTITDSGTVTVGFSAASASVAEGRTARLTVSLSGTVSDDVTVKWKTADATAGSADYTAQAATAVTIAAGTTAKTVTVRTAQDRLAEGGETFTASLETDPDNTLPTGVSLGTASATVTIADDESLLVNVSADAVSVAEGGNAAYTVAVTGGTSTAPVVVSYTVSGTATSVADYTAPSGSLTVASGDATAAITIATTADTVLDPGETLSVTLSAASTTRGSVSVGAPSEASVVLAEPTGTSVTVSLDPTSQSVAEGSAASFEAVLSGTVARDVVVKWKTVDGTAGSADYTAQAATSLTIAAGATRSGAFTVATAADTLSEDNETFRVELEADSGAPLPSNVSIHPTANTATATITDDSVTVSLDPASQSVAEGSPASFKAVLSGTVANAVVVSWKTAAGGTAISGTDYTAQAATSLTIAAGATSSGAFTVATAADTLSEGDETFQVRIAADGVTPLPSNVSIHPTGNTATATITDDAADAMTATVAVSAATVAEGSNAVFTVTLSGGTSTAPVVVSYETSGSATSATDYTAPSGSLTIAAGASTGTVTIATLTDTVLDPGETLELRLTGLSGGGGSSSLGTTATATTTITDSGTVTVDISAASASVAEGRTATLTVSLSGTVSAPVMVKWKTTAVSASSGTDYTAQAATALTIAAGATAKTVTVQTAQDRLAEGGETFTASLETDSENTLPAGVSLGTSSATVTIADDESLLVNVSADAGLVTEGGSAAYTVAVTGGTSTAPVEVSYTVSGTATTADDYTEPSGSLTVASGATTAVITIATTADMVLDPNETLRVTLSGASTTKGEVSVGAPSEASVVLSEPVGSSVTVSLDPASQSVAEGSPASFEAVLSETVASAVVVSWQTANGTAGSDDYTAQAATSLTIAAGATSSGAFTVATAADTLSEGDETFRVRIAADDDTPLPSDVSISPTANTATATITDDAADAMTATVAGSAETVAEGSDAVFTVTLSGGTSTSAVVVSYETGGTATSGTDYTAPSGSLTIAAGASTGTITVATAAESPALLEPNETLSVTLTRVSGGGGGSSSLGAAKSAETTITDSGTVTVGFSAPSASVAEGRAATLAVSLSGAVSDNVTVKWKTADGTARSADYTARTATALTIAAGATAKTVTVRTTQDRLAEGGETFSVSLETDPENTLPAGVSLGTSSATVTITDDESLLVDVSADAESVAEGGSAAYTVTVTGGTSTAPVVVSYETGGTATAADDYTAPSGSLTVASGQATAAITIATATDTVLDPDETLRVTLTGVSGGGGAANLGTGTSAETTLTDAGSVTVSLDPTDRSVAEGMAASFKAVLSGTVARDVVVKWSTADGTAGSDDYTAQAATSLTIAAGATSSGAFTVATAADTLSEGDETFQVRITADSGAPLPSNVSISLTENTVTATITDDAADALTATVAGSAATVMEGSNAVFTVTLSGGTSTAPAVVSYETTGNATSATDYTAPSGSLTIAAGVATGTVTIATLTDTVLDPGETLGLRLTGVSGGGGSSSLGTTATATTTITDSGAVTVGFSAASASVTEGRAATLTVSLSGPVSAPVTVKWKTSAGGTAISDTDYTTQAATAVTLAAGTTAKTLTVRTTQDRLAEGGETFSVSLETDSDNALPTGVSLGTSSATVTIADDEALRVNVSADAVSVAEGGSAAYTVTVTGGTSTAPVVVSYTVSGTATSVADYTAPSGSLTVASGATTAALAIATTADTVVDPNETLSVTLSGARTTKGEVSVGAPSAASVVLTEPTGSSVTVSLDPTSQSVAEGSPASFKAVLSRTVANAVVVSWSTADGTAGSDDYTAQAATSLTIAAGATSSAAFTVATAADTLSEGDETFRVRIAVDDDTPLPANVTIHPTANTATATITDDAADALTATVTGSAATVTEGSNAVFTVTLSGGTSTAPAVVSYETTGTATPDTDYTAPSGSLTIAAGASTGTITVATAAESPALLEPNETLSVTLTRVSGGGGSSSLGTTATAMTTITDSGTVTVGFSAASASVAEGRAATLIISLSGAVSDNVTVKWKTADGTARSADYTARTATSLTIAAGTTAKALTVQTTLDYLAEGSETFSVSLETDSDNALPTGVSLGTSSATVTIADDEALRVHVSADAVSVAEGGSAAYTVTVTGGTSTAPVVVSYETGGTATAADDYTAPSGSLTVASGRATAALAIATTADTVVDPNETLRVTLSGARTTKGLVSVGSPSAASLVLTEPTGSSVTVSLDPTSQSVAEGSPASFKAVLSRTVASDVVVSWSTADGTAGSADYTAQAATSLTIAAGATSSGTFTVATAADTLSEGAETFRVRIAVDNDTPLPANVTIHPTANTATATITDDAADALTATVTGSAATVTEGSNAEFTVTLSGGTSTAPVVVRYETSGTATPATDYTAPSGSLTIAAGVATGTVTIATLTDTVLDPGETLGLRLTGLSGGGGSSSLGTTVSAETTITDSGAVTVGFSAASASVAEGRAATLTVSLSGAVSAPVTVKWKTTGVSATTGTDYTTQALTAVTIAASATTASLTVQTTADTLAEGSETFTVSLEADTDNPLPSGVSLGTTSTTVTIDDDEALRVHVSADAVSVTEGGSAAYTVTVTGGTSTAPVVVSYTVSGTATSVADYTEPLGSLTVASGATTAALTIATTADTVLDPNETLSVTLSGARTTKGLVSVGSPAAASLVLTEPNGTSVTVSLEPTSRSVAEGTAASFEAVLSGTVASDVVVSWSTADGTAGSADYTAQAATSLTIAAGATSSGAFTVATASDTLSEGAETFRVRIAADDDTPLPSNVSISPTANTATATITDDAADALTATVAGSAAMVAEGSDAVFTVTLSGGTSTAPAVVHYETSGTATPDTDYTAPSGSLTIAAGVATGTVTIATLTDTVLDPGETLGLRLTGLSGGGGSSSLGTTATATTTITDSGAVTVDISAASASVAEGRAARLTVSLSGAVSDDVTVKWKTADATAGSADYTAQAATAVTLAAGTTAKTLTVRTTQDRLAEGSETFSVSLETDSDNALPAGVSLGTSSATVTIADDESLRVNVSADAVSVTEGGSAAYTVAVTGGTSTAPVVVSYTVSGTATSVADYTEPLGSLTVASGATTAALTIATTADTVLDPNETLSVTLSGARTTKGLVSVGSPAAASLVLTEPDGTSVTVSLEPTSRSVAEGTAASFEAVLSGTVASDVVVSWSTADGTAGSADYTAQAATSLTIAAGATRSTAFTVATAADTLSEGAETFRVRITAASGTPLPSNVSISPTANTATATITDDAADALTATVAGSAAMVTEGSDAVFTVTLSGGTSTAPVVVRYETSGTATPATDYTAPSGSLTIAAGVATGTVTIATLTDTVLDPGETLGLRLTGVSGGGGSSSLGTTVSAETTITDSGAVTVGISAASASVAEGRTATLTVSLSGAVSDDVTVKWKTVDGTAGSADYTTQAATALTIAAGTTSKTVTVQTTLDYLAEGSETFTASLETDPDNALPDGVSLGTSSATVTIADDGSLMVHVIADAVSVTEGDSAAYTVVVTGSISTAPVVVSYTVSGTATSGDDYTAPSGSLTVAAGDATAAIAIATLDDTVFDPNETLRVTLTGASTAKGSASVGWLSTAGMVLEEMAGSAVSSTVSLEPTSQSVAEGSPASFRAVLSEAVTSAVVVSWSTADGTAGSADYTAQAPTSLTIAAGATSSAPFTVATTADNLSEGAETFRILIAEDGATPLPPNVTIHPTANTATATITDDAADALTATVASSAATVAEGSNAVFTVTLSGGTSTAPVVVRYETTGSATPGSDYTAPSGSLTIAAGVASGTVSIATTADTVLDRGETLGLRLTGVSGGGSSRLGVPATATITITDPGTVTVGWSATSESVAEGQGVTLEVALSGAVASPVTVKWKTVDGTAGSADYTAQAATSVTIAAGEMAKTVTVQTTQDRLAEGDETFTASLETDPANALPAGVSLGSATTSIVTIVDDDEIEVTIAAVTTTVTEGEDAVFTVTAGGGESTAPVVVRYETSGTATSGSDYTAPLGSLTIAAGATSKTVTIATLTDAVYDPDETLRVTLTGASTAKGEARVAALPDNSATITIEDTKEIVFRERLARVSRAILPEMARATSDVTNRLIAERTARLTASTGEAASHARVGGSTLDRTLHSNQRAIEDGTFAAKQLLAGSSFLLPLNEAAHATPTGVGALAAWGSGDWRKLSGGDDSEVDWDGDVLGIHVGVDARLRTDLLAGLSVSWSEGQFDYTDNGEDGTPRDGAYQHRMTSVHPYLGWTAPGGLSVWATVGYGVGDIEIADDEIADEQSSDTTMKTVGAGAGKTLLSDDDLIAGGITTLKLKGDASFTRTEVEGRGLIDALSLDTSRLRLSLEGSHEHRLAGGGSLTPSVELGVRHDGGDGVTGSGVELGGELRYRNPATGLTVSGHGRWLAAHSGGLGEWGIGGLVRLDPGADKRGLSFSLGPAWGETESRGRRLWEEGAAGLTANDDAPAARFDAEIGYGLPALGGKSVLTPFGALTLAGEGARHYRVGTRLDLGPSATMGIEAERREKSGAAAPDHGVMLRAQLRF